MTDKFKSSTSRPIAATSVDTRTHGLLQEESYLELDFMMPLVQTSDVDHNQKKMVD